MSASRSNGRFSVAVNLVCIGGAMLLLTGISAAADEKKLAIVRAEVQQYQDGPPIPGGFEFYPGDTVFLTFHVAGYQLTENDIVRVAFTVDALDPDGVKLKETLSDEIAAELTFQDKKNEWMPIIRYNVLVPPSAPGGDYRLIARVTDEISKSTTESELQFRVRGHAVEPSDTLIVRNFRFLRTETSTQPLASPVYRPGDSVWARFDITGYEFAEGNKFSIEYGIKVLRASKKLLFEQPVAAAEENESFYPQRHMPGSLSLNLTKDLAAGEYTIIVTVRDKISGQNYNATEVFEVQ